MFSDSRSICPKDECNISFLPNENEGMTTQVSTKVKSANMSKKIDKWFFVFIGILLLLNSCDKTADRHQEDKKISYRQMKSEFQLSSTAYGTNCWWWWLNGNVNRAAIRKDLEAMKSKNFQGAMIFDAGGHNQRGITISLPVLCLVRTSGTSFLFSLWTKQKD